MVMAAPSRLERDQPAGHHKQRRPNHEASLQSALLQPRPERALECSTPLSIGREALLSAVSSKPSAERARPRAPRCRPPVERGAGYGQALVPLPGIEG